MTSLTLTFGLNAEFFDFFFTFSFVSIFVTTVGGATVGVGAAVLVLG